MGCIKNYRMWAYRTAVAGRSYIEFDAPAPLANLVVKDPRDRVTPAATEPWPIAPDVVAAATALHGLERKPFILVLRTEKYSGISMRDDHSTGGLPGGIHQYLPRSSLRSYPDASSMMREH